MNLKEIYEKEILNEEQQYIETSVFSETPIMTSKILTPESTISIQPLFNIEFEVDKKGMYDLIDILEESLNKKDEKQRKNLVVLLTDIYTATEKFLGGHGKQKDRQNAYMSANRSRLKLSEIKDRKVGLCAERAAMAHQLLTLLEKEGTLVDYKSYFTNSYLKTKTKEPHAFIVLQHKTDKRKQFLFDIENPMEYRLKPDSEPTKGIALYSMNEEEFKNFKKGKCLKLTSIYEKLGMPVLSETRMYGNKEFYQERER